MSSEESRIVDSIRERVEALPEDLPLRGALQSLLREADEDLDQSREALKTWYDDNMDRVASWHKKHAQRAVVVIAAVIAIGANADTLRMAQQLSTNDTLRQAAVQQSQQVVQRGVPDTAASLDALADSTQKYVGAYSELGLPIEWEFESFLKKNASVRKYTGFGAPKPSGSSSPRSPSLWGPLWFDVLKKVSMIRPGGAPRERSDGIRPLYGSHNRIRSPAPRSWVTMSNELPNPEVGSSAPSIASSGTVALIRDSTYSDRDALTGTSRPTPRDGPYPVFAMPFPPKVTLPPPSR